MPLLFDNKKVLVADSAYDSQALEDQVKNMRLGILIRNRNKRRRSERIELELRERVI